jgi:hypothetical protein
MKWKVRVLNYIHVARVEIKQLAIVTIGNNFL